MSVKKVDLHLLKEHEVIETVKEYVKWALDDPGGIRTCLEFIPGKGLHSKTPGVCPNKEACLRVLKELNVPHKPKQGNEGAILAWPRPESARRRNNE